MTAIQLSFQVPELLAKAIDEYADELLMSRADVVRRALAEFMNRQKPDWRKEHGKP